MFQGLQAMPSESSEEKRADVSSRDESPKVPKKRRVTPRPVKIDWTPELDDIVWENRGRKLGGWLAQFKSKLPREVLKQNTNSRFAGAIEVRKKKIEQQRGVDKCRVLRADPLRVSKPMPPFPAEDHLPPLPLLFPPLQGVFEDPAGGSLPCEDDQANAFVEGVLNLS